MADASLSNMTLGICTDGAGNLKTDDGYITAGDVAISLEGPRALEFADEIVRACNAHDDLLASLQELLDYDGGAANALEDEYVVERARAAISAAEAGRS